MAGSRWSDGHDCQNYRLTAELLATKHQKEQYRVFIEHSGALVQSGPM